MSFPYSEEEIASFQTKGRNDIEIVERWFVCLFVCLFVYCCCCCLVSWIRNTRNHTESTICELTFQSTTRYPISCAYRCKEMSYPETRFNGNILTIPFEDHCPPPLILVHKFIKDMVRILATSLLLWNAVYLLLFTFVARLVDWNKQHSCHSL